MSVHGVGGRGGQGGDGFADDEQVEEFLQGGEAVERVIDALRGREIADRVHAYKSKN